MSSNIGQLTPSDNLVFKQIQLLCPFGMCRGALPEQLLLHPLTASWLDMLMDRVNHVDDAHKIGLDP
eukprot:1086367-Pelagomonas_calceolata.AAC.3